MSIQIGEVVAVNGIQITIRVFEESNRETLFFRGAIYKGVSIREYVAIERGFVKIICIVEGEYLDENKLAIEGGKSNFVRFIKAKPIGFFKNEVFNDGVKFLPMIKDFTYLLREDEISSIYNSCRSDSFVVGKMLKEEIPISLPWEKLFNSHVGIFGNTGSGKSNTLAKLYTKLFEEKIDKIRGRSNFILIDFNGEYVGNQFFDGADKKIIKLDTSKDKGADKITLYEEEFWDIEVLGMLFQATQNTQKPFLSRVVNNRKKYQSVKDSLLNYTQYVIKLVFTTASPKPECLDLLRRIVELIGGVGLLDKLKTISWFSNSKFKGSGANEFYNGDEEGYKKFLQSYVDALTIEEISPLNELIVRVYLQLTNELVFGFVQFDHIQPLLKRVESSMKGLEKVVDISNERLPLDVLTIVSLRRCNQEIKKIIPLLIAKHFYTQHRLKVASPPMNTLHLIVDEAHNVLSRQSATETSNWKDYRLELFEEIIKEGRKFGMFLTISSQRPADISPTIVSQVHNFFIHRLVNDRDLFLLDNTISTLDSISRSLIPSLPKGACVVTGVSFTLPMILQFDSLGRSRQPDSEDVDLEELWK